MKRSSPSLTAALSDANSILQNLAVDSRGPTIPRGFSTTPLDVNAGDSVVEMPDIIDQNDRRGFYPAQDGYARDPQTDDERNLARASQYGVNWQEQKRQHLLLLNRDLMYSLVKAIAGATARPIDRYVQRVNQELIDIQRQQALERARREIAIYGPDFIGLEQQIIHLEDQRAKVIARREELDNTVVSVYDTVITQDAYRSADAARRRGNWWVMPTDVLTFSSDRYARIITDLEQLFAGDSVANVRVFMKGTIPQSFKDLLYGTASLEPGIQEIDVFPYFRGIYTAGLVRAISYYNDSDDALRALSAEHVLMVAYLLMNGGVYSSDAFNAFQAQLNECTDLLKGIVDENDRKREILFGAMQNWDMRIRDSGGDLRRAVVALYYLSRSRPHDDATGFLGITGIDPAIMIEMTGNLRTSAGDILVTIPAPAVGGGPRDTGPVSLRELCNRKFPGGVKVGIEMYVDSMTKLTDAITMAYTQGMLPLLFRAWLYFIGLFVALSGILGDRYATLLRELAMQKDVVQWNQAAGSLVTPTIALRSLLNQVKVPQSLFVSKDLNGHSVPLVMTDIPIADVPHLRAYEQRVRQIFVESVRSVATTQIDLVAAIQQARRRLIDMTRENYDTIKKHIDKLILSGEMDVRPSLYNMGNSPDYGTDPGNFGLIVLTPLAHYGIWSAYEKTQDPSTDNNGLVGLPFDEFLRHRPLAIAFARFVAASLVGRNIATGTGYQSTVRAHNIPYELFSASRDLFAFGYSIIHRDPTTGEVLDPPRYKVVNRNSGTRTIFSPWRRV